MNTKYAIGYNLRFCSTEQVQAVTELVFQFQERNGLVIDGMLGPKTRALAEHHARSHRTPRWYYNGISWAETALTVLRELDGRGEEGSNNNGPLIEQIGGNPGQPWCAALIFYVLEQAWIRSNWPIDKFPLQRTNGARALTKKIIALDGQELAKPEPGAIVLFPRGTPGRDPSWWGHIGMVGSVSENGDYLYWNGNEGPFPARVRLSAPYREAEAFVRLPNIAT